eukprot:COSAG01_NODE_21564_length_896_cov_1.110414_1_plen_124_part_10
MQRLGAFLGVALPPAKLSALRARVSLGAMASRNVITVRKGVRLTWVHGGWCGHHDGLSATLLQQCMHAVRFAPHQAAPWERRRIGRWWATTRAISRRRIGSEWIRCGMSACAVSPPCNPSQGEQ